MAGKGDYSVPGAWQPIALQNTLGMVLKRVIAQPISSFSEKQSLLPAQLRGTRPVRSLYTALDFIVQQIHATWKNQDGVATLLSLNLIEAFDRVIPARVLQNMRERKNPE
jgi:hypothetical protein